MVKELEPGYPVNDQVHGFPKKYLLFTDCCRAAHYFGEKFPSHLQGCEVARAQIDHDRVPIPKEYELIN